MGYICDFCGDQRSMVYCRSDAACLCLSCDRNVHSANALSRRHSRTLLCERCNSQPALVRCTEERVSLCQNCDWMGHGTSTSASAHKRQTLNCYSGCPSASELSSIWSFVLDLPAAGESACEQEMGLMSIAENSTGSAWSPPESNTKQNASGIVEVNGVRSVDKSGVLVGSSSVPELNPATHVVGQQAGSENATLPKLFCHGTKGPAIPEDDDLYDDFDMDEMDLNLENYEELFGVSLNHSEELFKNGGIDSLFGAKNMSRGNSNYQDVGAAEGSSVGLVNALQPACSNAASADSVMSTKTDPIICFPAKQAQSNLSFSGVTGESSAGDCQDCGASSMLLMGEPPWCPPCPESSMQSANRSNAVMRYKEKKKARKFDKRVRYASRKARADVRKRVKGRFIKAGEAYDYDPLNQARTRSY
ncbi:PREDICTED: zinc finger [Prunus dulcis]|nr:zinc finger protein CONSTANS-LIKE 9-like [Prunus dulcis]XP_034208638.1 zinc finger protein CONSTANS-LIKE 9-like [Prunus dulcis]XP_034208639.1 zinc finger protein CONSTANS-LIKE 9-like [Prunus dulcis]VVA26415.1 PREDICTED: zinc finger [Prunus dulcis]